MISTAIVRACSPLASRFSAGRATQGYPEGEAERAGSVDHDVKLTLGSVEITGGITLHVYNTRDPGTYEMPIDTWCSAEIVRAITPLTKASQNAILSALSIGQRPHDRARRADLMIRSI